LIVVFVDAFPPLLSAALGIARKERKKEVSVLFSLRPNPFSWTPLSVCSQSPPLGWLVMGEFSAGLRAFFFFRFFFRFSFFSFSFSFSHTLLFVLLRVMDDVWWG